METRCKIVSIKPQSRQQDSVRLRLIAVTLGGVMLAFAAYPSYTLDQLSDIYRTRVDPYWLPIAWFRFGLIVIIVARLASNRKFLGVFSKRSALYIHAIVTLLTVMARDWAFNDLTPLSAIVFWNLQLIAWMPFIWLVGLCLFQRIRQSVDPTKTPGNPLSNYPRESLVHVPMNDQATGQQPNEENIKAE